jgi:hypothetical protein
VTATREARAREFAVMRALGALRVRVHPVDRGVRLDAVALARRRTQSM